MVYARKVIPTYVFSRSSATKMHQGIVRRPATVGNTTKHNFDFDLDLDKLSGDCTYIPCSDTTYYSTCVGRTSDCGWDELPTNVIESGGMCTEKSRGLCEEGFCHGCFPEVICKKDVFYSWNVCPILSFGP